MLATTVELWPFGDDTSRKTLVSIGLANIGHSTYDDTGHKCDYVWTIDEQKPIFGIEPIKAQGVIYEYDRRASCVDLLAKILSDYKEDASPEMTDYQIGVAERLRNRLTQ